MPRSDHATSGGPEPVDPGTGDREAGETGSGDPGSGTPSPRDPDFAEEVLADLYRYREKRPWLAWTLWLTLGLLGAHRFYLDRHVTALLLLLTGGGFGIWWIVDAFLLRSMLRTHNWEQRRRKAAGEPPLELDFMPPLSRDVLREAPEWTKRWAEAGRTAGILRLVGDLTVLVVAGVALGALTRDSGVWEAVVAVGALAGLTAAGAEAGSLRRLPVLGDLVRWGHRVRLFYYYNAPGSSLALLFRPVVGLVQAPFRRRARAEARLYLELGGVFTLAFLVLDVVEALVEQGPAALTPEGLAGLVVAEATTTFLVIYAFATPIGAALTAHLLVRSSHTVPRILSAVTLLAVTLGFLGT